MTRRPLIAVPGRRSSSAAALRFRATVAAERLCDAVVAAGGEPLVVHPRDDAAAHAWCDGVLLPGGGDLDPALYGDAERHEAVYDVDALQDRFDLALARWAFASGRPLLAICRGMQVVNVGRGGTLRQHLAVTHQGVRTPVLAVANSTLAGVFGEKAALVSCFHHQAIDQLGAGLLASAHAADGTVEGLECADTSAFFLAVQWHPEDTWDTDARQLGLFAALVDAAAQAGSPALVLPGGP